MNKKVGEKIRQIRILKGLSQENVADAIGMSFGNFGKIERGEIEVNSSKLIEIAKFMKVSPADFFEERTKQVARENRPDYGYVTKEEFSEVTKVLQALVKEVESLREALPAKKKKIKRPYTKKQS